MSRHKSESKPLRFITRKEGCSRIGIHEMTSYRHARQFPDFPKLYLIGLNKVAFREDEVDAYIASRPVAAETPHHSSGGPKAKGARAAEEAETKTKPRARHAA